MGTPVRRKAKVEVLEAPRGTRASALHRISEMLPGSTDGSRALAWTQFAGGLAIGIVGLKWRWALALLVAAAGVEALVLARRRRSKGVRDANSWKRVGTDVAFALTGYAFGRIPDPPRAPRP